MAASHARAKARFSAMGIVVKKPNVPIMTAVSRRKTARKVMQPKGAVETGIQKLLRLPRALRIRVAMQKRRWPALNKNVETDNRAWHAGKLG